MPSAVTLRSQIEAALANRIPAALTPAPRIQRAVFPTGVGAVDEMLGGGLPVGALTEMVGPECSGRTSLALAFVAQVTRAEKVCAWVDVSDALSPESAAACGVDLTRLLWVRCGMAPAGSVQKELSTQRGRESRFAVPKQYFVPKPVMKGLHGGGMGGHPRGEAKGMGDAVSSLLGAGTAARQQKARLEREVVEPPRMRGSALPGQVKLDGCCAVARPWLRMEQALRVCDLLLQAGGFGAIVLDMGSQTPEQVSRIPLATWFRYRAAAERTQTSVLLLTQYACSKSSAGLMLRLHSSEAVSQGATVLAGFERRIEVVRQRFPESAAKVVPMRKPPQRAGVATWRSGTAWAGR